MILVLFIVFLALWLPVWLFTLRPICLVVLKFEIGENRCIVCFIFC